MKNNPLSETPLMEFGKDAGLFSETAREYPEEPFDAFGQGAGSGAVEWTFEDDDDAYLSVMSGMSFDGLTEEF
jgi:hypothetical protein